MKYCKDCKFYKSVDYDWFLDEKCSRPELKNNHLIKGPLSTDPMDNRKDQDKCGESAEFFVQREPSRLSKLCAGLDILLMTPPV